MTTPAEVNDAQIAEWRNNGQCDCHGRGSRKRRQAFHCWTWNRYPVANLGHGRGFRDHDGYELRSNPRHELGDVQRNDGDPNYLERNDDHSVGPGWGDNGQRNSNGGWRRE